MATEANSNAPAEVAAPRSASLTQVGGSHELAKHMLRAALLLGTFAIVGTGLVALTYEQTHEQIALNEHEALLRKLHELIPPKRYDNDLARDTIEVTSRALLGTPNPVTVYRARLKGEPVAAVLTAVAPDGYSGNIVLLVAVNDDGTLAGVRVITHHETPGLGDAVDEDKSDWIRSFDGKSLSNPAPSGWAVRKDGGAFDQFTGATITPRAVVGAVRRALQFFAENRERLFAQPTKETS